MIPDSQSTSDEQTDKDAIFVEQYRMTGDPVQACIRAGIRDPRYPITVTARRQLDRPEIQAAVKALEKIEIAQMPLEVTRDSIIADMQAVYEQAMTDGQLSAAIASKKLQSALLGILSQNINVMHGFRVDQMTNDQLMHIIDGTAKDVTRDVKMIEQGEEDAD